MAKTWAEITADAEFAALPAADQEQVREAFWQRRVQPSLGEGADIEQARAYFDKATRIRKVDMAPDIVPSTAGAGRGLAAAPVIPTRKGGLRRESVPFVGGTAREGLAAAETPPQQDTMPYDVVPVVGPADEGGVGKGVRGVLSDIKANTAARNARMGSPLDLPRDPATVNGSRDAPPPVEGPGVMSRENDVFAPAVGQLSERQKAVLQSRNPQIAKERAAQERSWGEMRPVDSQQKLAWAVEDAVAGKNPVLRGAVAGVAGLGKIGVGAVRLAADLAGADDVAAFAAGAAGAASATERGATQGLQGNEKLVADVTNSIINSAPSVALGMAGGPALRTLFATSTLQEYNAGRDAGFGVPESLSRAGIMGTAEALGERYGFPQQNALLKGAVKGMPKGEVARVFGDMLAKEIPGEQLTTAIQFLADKIGPAALRPNATLADYLEAAGDTLAVTVAQTGVMGGGPAAISTVRNTYQAADRAAQAPESAIAGAINQTADAFSRFYQPAPEATAPTAARADSLKRFDEAAAAWGLSPKAAEAVRAQAGAMPAGDVPGFLARVSAAFAKRGLYKKAPDDASVAELDKRLRPPPAEPEAAAQPTPAPMPPAPAAQESTDVAQPDLAAAAAVSPGPADAGGDQSGRGLGTVGPDAAEPGRVAADPAAAGPGGGADPAAGTGSQPNTPLTSKFTPEQAMARMERQAAADGQRRAETVEFEDREATDILSPKGTAWAGRVGAAKRLRELGDGYRLARVSTGWVIKPEAAAAQPEQSAPRPEWAAFPAESGSKGIPRADMPQIKAEHRGAMVQFLKGRGILHEQEQDVDPATLKATQAEYSPAKVDRARAFTEGDRAILVSSDGHILDGHHQWVAALADKKPIRVIRLDAPIDQLLPVVREFPSAESAAGATAAAPAPDAAAPVSTQAPAEAGATVAAAPAAKDDGEGALVDAYNAALREYRAAGESGDKAGEAAVLPRLRAAKQALDEFRRGRLASDMRNFKARQAEATKKAADAEATRLAGLPVGSRMRPTEHAEEKGLYWEKTGPDEWTGRGEWFQKDKARSSADLAGWGMVPMAAASAQQVPAAPAATGSVTTPKKPNVAQRKKAERAKKQEAATPPATPSAAADGAAMLRERGFNESGPAADEWALPVSGLGDIIAKVVSKPGEPVRMEISADYMGKRLDTRTAEGGAAIDEAIQRARDGINAGRERMAQKVRADESGLPQDNTPAIEAAPKDAAAPAAGQPAVADGEKAPVTRSAGPEAAAPSAPAQAVKKPASINKATATPQGAIDAFNADDSALAVAIMAKLDLAGLEQVGAAVGFRPQIRETAKAFRERIGGVADRLTKTAREKAARQKALYDKLIDRAMAYDRAADHMANSLRLGNAIDSPANMTGYKPMEGRDEGGWVPIPEALDKYAADVDSLRNDPEWAEVAPMVSSKRPRVFEHKAASSPAPEKTTPAAEGGSSPAAPSAEEKAAPPKATVENFGETLPPARRVMAAKLDESLSDEDIARRPLSEIWPLAENEAIEDTFAAAVAHAARAAIPAKPRQPYKLKRWVESVKTMRGLAGHVVAGRLTPERLAEEVAGRFASLKDWRSKVVLLEQLPREQWKRIGVVEERPDAFSYTEDSKRVPSPMLRITVDDKSHWLSGDGTVSGSLDQVRALLGEAAPEQRMQFEVRGSGPYKVNKKGDPEYRALMTFGSAKEAFDAIREGYDGLVAAWEQVKARDNVTERDVRSAENRPRAGKDYRGGKDVTPEQFQEQFGFRGGEWGKWVKQGKGDKERQALLNSAYDALMDLADIVGIPPRAISLNGTLGIAFGSRGSGWASAHFEPSNLVINLTKTRGAGALAHEWLHALDNYFARMRRGGAEATFNGDQTKYRNENYITHRPEPLMVRKDRSRHFPPMTVGQLEAKHEARQKKGGMGWPEIDAYAPEKWERDPATPEGVRPEVEARFAALVQVLKDSPMAKRAALLDKGGGYWSRTLEVAARAFESFVQARMMEQGYHNDFLANVVPVENFARDPGRYPYLLAGEVKPIAEAFDGLFGALETRTDDAGNVVLFSRTMGDPSPARKAFSRLDDLFALPSTDATDVTEIARAIDPGIKVTPHLAEGLDRYDITMPGGATASIYVREPSPWGPHTYGNTYDEDNNLIATTTERPGANRNRVPEGTGDVWVNVSKFKRGDGGAKVYAIAGALAHNTGRIFIGDPNGVSDDAMQRRPEQMLSLALRYGTTDFLAPHPQQLLGSAKNGIPPLKWSYGDDAANIRALIDLNLRALENQGYGDDSLRFDLDTGTYRDGSGQELSRADIAALAASGFGRGALAGGNSLARAAVLRALLREGRREGEAGGGRDGLLAAIAKLRDDSPQAVAGLFKRADEAQPAEQGRQVEVARVTATAKAVREAWAVKPDLVVFFGLQDPKLPPSVRDYDNQQRSQGAVGDIEGFYWQGRIYVNAAALQTDADVVRVMYHEGLGHAGLRGHFGSELDRVLDQMARLYDQRALQKKAVAYGEANTDKDGNFVSYKTEKSAALAAEELLAELAQTRPTSMWVRRAIAAIRTWLRENLPGLFGKMALSDAEVIERFIVPARGFIERGRAAQQRDAVPAFSRGDESDKDLIAQLQEFGRMAVSRMDAERAFNDGDRLFVVHDQSDEDTLPTEVNSVRQLDPYAPDQIMILPAERAMFGRTDQTQRKGTEDDAIAAGFTLKAYRGISKARPFNDTGTTWLTTSREVAEAYAEEVMGYDDPGVLTVMVKPDNLPRHDASRLTDEQREELQADGFGNPQAVGIYDRSDDHPLGGSRRNVTVIHAPREAVFVIDDDGSRLSRAASVTDTPAFRAWFGDSKVVDEQGKPLVVYHGTRESFDAFDTAKQSDRAWYGKGFYFASDPKAAGGLGTADARGELPTFQELEWAASFNGAGFAWQNQRWQLSRPLTGADARKVVQRLGTKVALRDAREDIGTADRWRSVMRAAQEGPEALTRELATNGNAWGVLDKIGVARDIASAPNVMPLYLSIQNPAIWPAKPGPEHDGIHDPVKGYWIAFRPEQIKSATGNRGTFDPTSADIRFSRTAEKTTKAERKKLAQALTNGTNAMRGVRLPAQYVLGDLVGKSVGRLHWWHRTVGTPFNLALMQPQFKPVYDSLQDFIGDISHYASEAQKLAPRLLPRMDGIRDVFKGPISAADAKAVAAPVFEGTLGWIRTAQGDPIKVEDAEAQAASMSADEKAQEMLRSNLLSARVLKMWQGLPVDQYEAAIETRYASQVLRPGVVWSDAELRSMFKLTDSQIDLYKEFRTATDKSLDDLTISAMLRVAGDDAADIRARVLEESDLNAAAEMIRDRLFEMAESDPANADRWNEKGNDVIDMADRVEDLKARGYAPLMRFGSLTLDVVTPDGQRQYFGLFENDRERKRKVREMRANFPDAEITQGTVSQREFELFAGVTPETLELFADKLGIPKEVQEGEIYQKWLQFAKSNRSGLKRLIHRKGVPGFSEEVGRVLAAFIYSNARQTSGNLHAGAAEKAMADIDQRDGELKDYAKGLIDSVRNPTEQAQALKAMMFTQFLGGSFASALVNMTQPFTVTGPYLAQYGGEAKAAKQMAAALKDVGRRVFPNDPGLAKALRLAEEDGTVMPQEIFSLQAQASGRAQLSSGDGTVLGTAGKLANNGRARLSLLWGRPFAWAEMFNRRLTYIAAYRTAVDQGMPDPAAFAKDAVNTTQIVYNAGNRPKWARSYAGAVLMTFKQFATSMIELLARSMRTPQGRRTALAMLLMLVVVSGLEGLPFREDIEDLIDGFMQRVLDQNFSTKEWRNRKLVEGLLAGLREFGVTDPKWAQGIADGLNNGLTGIPGMPFDVSGRLGLHNLIPGTGLLLKKESYGRDVAELAGPAGSFGARLFEAGGQALSGSPGKALLTASPLGVQNAAKGLEMAKTGRYPDTKDNMVVRTTLGDAISKGAGFQPQRVKVAQDVTFQQKRFTALAQQVEGEIVDTIAKGLVKEDEAQQKEGWDRLAAWNEKNPKTPIKITAQQIRTRVQNMTTEKTVRMMKTTPRELRPGLADAFRKLEPAGADE